MKDILRLLFLFTCLCFSPFAGAQAGVTLLVKTGISCNWKLDGQPMGLLMADDSKVVLVSPGEHLIEAFPTDGMAIVRTRVEVEKVEKTVDIGMKSQNDQQSKLQQAESPRTLADADAAQYPTWTDPATGLMWTAKDNGSDVDQPQATAYCSTLQYAGYKDWHLPTLEQLQGIYDPRVSVRTPFGDGYTAYVHVKGNLKLTGWTWSGLQGDAPGQPYQTAWLLKLGAVLSSYDVGKPVSNFLHFNWDMRALCVRSPENVVVQR